MATTTTGLTGDDIDTALQMIEENGGSGDFDTLTDTPVERYLFPRFHGATDDADFYMSRLGIGQHDTDVETICAWLKAPRNRVGGVLLLGPPGGGKTSLLEAAVTHLGTKKKPRPMTTVCFTPDHTRENLFYKFVGEGHGDCIIRAHEHDDSGTDFTDECNRSPFTLGPVPYAAKHGHILYGDEAMQLDDGVWPSMYPLMDGRHILPEGNIDGSDLVIHPDFRVVLSSNPEVRNASLPEPVMSRCAGTTMTVVTDAALLFDLGIDEAIIECWKAMGSAGLFQPQVRELLVADYWLSVNGEADTTQAASALVPEHCPESERSDVTALVRSYIGGNLRSDGRMVVK